MQTEIPQREDIPEKIFLLFKVCNSSDNWPQKPAFYLLKNLILPMYGKSDEYDLQIIHRKCRSCNGTGLYKKRASTEQCWDCTDGIYTIDRIALARFILNGELFHLPECKVGVNGRSIGVGKHFLYRNTINGIVKHESLRGDRKFKNILDPTFAYYVLLSHYDPDKLTLLVLEKLNSLQTRAKHKFKLALKEPTHLRALAKYMNINIIPYIYTNPLIKNTTHENTPAHQRAAH